MAKYDDSIIVTLQQIKDVVREGKILPEDVFGKNYMETWRESQNYAEKILGRADYEERQAKAVSPPIPGLGEKAEEEKKDTDDDPGKYLDPGKNPLLPGQEKPEPEKESKAEDMSRYLNPDLNPLIRTSGE